MHTKLINIVVCPICKNKFIYNKKRFICIVDKLFFPIKQGIPILIKEKAKPLNKKFKYIKKNK